MSSPAVQSTSQVAPVGTGMTNLGDILERVLDRGLVIAGDIKVSLLDIELLTLKLRLVIASVDTARQMGIDWWQHDPWLTSGNNEVRNYEVRNDSDDGERRDLGVRGHS